MFVADSKFLDDPLIISLKCGMLGFLGQNSG